MANPATNRAIQMLRHDGIIAHQTDTVFGLACLPKENLLQRLSYIKHRENNKQGYILLASQVAQLVEFIDCTEEETKKLSSPKPKPTTWLVNANKNVAPSLLGKTNKIAVRLTSQQNIELLCEYLGPIASTSANISKLDICQNAGQVRNMFGTSIDYIESDSNPGTGHSSTIVDLQSGQVIRN